MTTDYKRQTKYYHHRSVLRASKFSVLKLIEIVIFGFITPSLLASDCLGIFWHHFFNYFVWQRITDEG